ncbi:MULTISPECIES: PIN domain-containing protein [unclassified Agreia]|uniref:PIN domain-containing protein n=1 Tax=unclassified Agreia TaxID=2641148 RepID=UPI0006FE1600|nr:MULTISPECIES: PIN domain-containing protein [unclassified Agreia]KQM59279.1 hypothetical protein ASE64_07740 [Agreia sp. Leaf210]KQO09927.1 hypothetical protein ASF06_06685 [Agreia sp. Leaf244]
MLVVVDANIIMKDPILRDRKWQVATTAIDAGRLRLVLPEVARLEVIGGYRRGHEEKMRQIKGVVRKSTNRAKDAAKALLQVYIDELTSYESILDRRLREIGFEIPGVPVDGHLEVTERAVNRLAPFDENGGGYRDTLLWLTAMGQIAETPFDNLVLVSDDGVFSRRRLALAEELRREAGAELTVSRSIAGVEFPDEYEDIELDLSSLDIDISQIVDAITVGLDGMDITQWSPPGPDHAEVKIVGRVDLDLDSAEVKKRYGSDVYEMSVAAVTDVDVEILIIVDSYDGTDFSQMAGRWDLGIQWRGETEGSGGYAARLSDNFTLEVLWLNDRSKRPRRV